jgi:hypothetical protein
VNITRTVFSAAFTGLISWPKSPEPHDIVLTVFERRRFHAYCNHCHARIGTLVGPDVGGTRPPCGDGLSNLGGRCGWGLSRWDGRDRGTRRFMSSVQPLGSRLKSAAASTRSPCGLCSCAQALSLRSAGSTQPSISFKKPRCARARHTQRYSGPSPSDYIRPSLAEIAGLLRAVMGGYPGAEQGLLIARRFFDAIGGHSDGADAERALFRRLGRRRLAVLATTVTVVRQDT